MPPKINIPKIYNTKKKKSRIDLLEEELLQDDDDDALDFEAEKPTWTGYDSWNGRKFFPSTKKWYNHYETGPDGSRVIAPKLTHQEWAARHESFNYVEESINPKTKEKIYTEVLKPAVLSSLQLHFLDLMEKFNRLLILAFRESRKSITLTLFAKRCNIDLWKNILYCSETGNMAIDFTNEMKDQYATKESILKDYGYVINKEKGAKKTALFLEWQKYTETTRFPALSLGSSQGVRRTGSHNDIICLDDILGESCEGHPETMKKISRWYKKQIAPMVKANKKIIIVGTFKDPNDLYNELIRTEMFKVVIIRAIEVWPNNNQREPGTSKNPDNWYYVRNDHNLIAGVAGLVGGIPGWDEYGEVCWHLQGRVQYYLNDDPNQGLDKNRMAIQEFLLKRREIGNAAFESEYQLNAITVDKGYLQLDNLAYFDYGGGTIDSPLKEDLLENVVAMFDQSFGSSNFADYNCITIMSAMQDLNTEEFHYYILDWFLWRGGGIGKKLQMIDRIMKKYPTINKFGVEGGQINSADLTVIQNYFEGLINIVPVFQNRKPKAEEAGFEIRQVQYDLSAVPDVKRGKVRRILNQLDTPLQMKLVHLRNGIGKGVSDSMDMDIDQEVEMDPIAELERERQFPFCGHFDLLDSTGSALELIDTFSEKDFYFGHGSI